MGYDSVLQTRRIRLRPAIENDYPLLFQWRNNPGYIKLCSTRRYSVNWQHFLKELKIDFRCNRHLQFLIELQSSQQPIGTIFSFSLNKIDGYVFITIFLEEKFVGKGFGVDAVALLIVHLFSILPIHKVYFDVFGYNDFSASALRGIGFAEEGRFKEHRVFEGVRYDLFRFAVYRDSLVKIQVLLRFLERRAQTVHVL